jgi:hypothetical protein
VNLPEALRHSNKCQDFCWIKKPWISPKRSGTKIKFQDFLLDKPAMHVNIPEVLRHSNKCQDFCWINQQCEYPRSAQALKKMPGLLTG